jgi:hypothetical protein
MGYGRESIMSVQDITHLLCEDLLTNTFSKVSQGRGIKTWCVPDVGIPIDSGMGLSLRIDKLRVFINKTLSTQNFTNQLLIKRVDLSISVNSR